MTFRSLFALAALAGSLMLATNTAHAGYTFSAASTLRVGAGIVCSVPLLFDRRRRRYPPGNFPGWFPIALIWCWEWLPPSR